MRLHLTGICGTGMGAVAGLLVAAGHEVRGSDQAVYPPMSDQLAALGVPVFSGYAAANLDWAPDRVVVGNTCKRGHVEVVAAQERGLELTSFPALLEELFLAARHSVVVAGTHGKTTTTSLLAHVLAASGRDPSFLVGGVPRGVGRGYHLGAGPHFVIEGDEYDTAFFDKGSKFLHYRPRTAILTSVELDHVDIFASFAAVKDAFRRFVALIPEDGRLFVAASSPAALEVAAAARCRVETYAAGARGTASWRAEIVEAGRARTRFRVLHDGARVAELTVPLAGEYNVENALAVVAATGALGVDAAAIAAGLASFAGVKRRQELVGLAGGVAVLDDYAHHPTAVRETLGALRADGARVIAVYEPRSGTSRRATFQREFVAAFTGAAEVVVADVFAPESIPVAERFDPRRLAADLCASGTPARMVADVGEIVEVVARVARSGDVVAVFSSGGFAGIHGRLLERLGDPVVPALPADAAAVRALLPDAPEGETVVLRGAAGLRGCARLAPAGAGRVHVLVAAPADADAALLAEAGRGFARWRGAEPVTG